MTDTARPFRIHETFTSRWGLLLSILGVAVGTGNIWRFPRIVAANGGGSFLIPWMVFLFLWSIPLVMTEIALGKRTRYGTVGSFAALIGRRFAWMGVFVGFVATAIMFYYSVVAGWCLRYLSLALTGHLFSRLDPTADWYSFVQSGWQPILFHMAALTAAALVIQKGIVKGIERVNRFLIPALLVLIFACAVRAVTLPGAAQGLAFLFTPDLRDLMDYRIWLQALTQNAWDTGAGWGLILTYAVYMRRSDDVPLNAALIGLGNNSVSLLAGITVFCTVFALIPQQAEEVLRTPGPANTGLTFIWFPQLFQQMGAGGLFAILFFLALTFAALSSLISMLELSTRVLMDMKMSRTRALQVVYTVTLVMGIPSALSTDFFLNQDWTWGVGLMLSGALMSSAVIHFGPERFRRKLVNSDGSDLQVGRWYNYILGYLIPVQVLILVTWWFWQVIQADPENWWNPFQVESVGTCLLQWSAVIALALIGNRWISGRIFKS